uniref:Pre-mRNA-splicing factor SLU7 n=1 Tax=Chenopodium quinoa TaxID=63459 RepID=A0A803ME60_CHEQI
MKWKSELNHSKAWYRRGEKGFQADRFRKGSCLNCGAKTHDAKSCTDRPRRVGAKYNGFDSASYVYVVHKFEIMEEAIDKHKKEQQLKKLEEKSNTCEEGEGKEDALKVDESKQMDFAKVEKRVRTTGGGNTGTVRNLRIREDTAKYLLNLDVDSAYYDPKTRSMREDPLPDADPNEKFYAGDNQNRLSGQALELKLLNLHAFEAFDKGQDVHMQAAPTQVELLHKNFKVNKEKLKTQVKDTIMEKYGNAAAEEEMPRELLLGQSDRQVEYDRSGRIIKGQEMAVPKSKYEEDVVYTNNHTAVWGSWWSDFQWGYKCCKQAIRNSYCTGAAGIEAAEAMGELMKANIALKETSEEKPELTEEKRLPTWCTERKRKYNMTYDNDVTPEEIEAFRMKKIHHDDPMKDYL